MRPHGSPEQLERRRRKALELLEQRYQPVEVANKVGVDRRSVRRWKAAYRKNGMQAIRAKPAEEVCVLADAARRHSRSVQRKQHLLRSFLKQSPLPLRLK